MAGRGEPEVRAGALLLWLPALILLAQEFLIEFEALVQGERWAICAAFQLRGTDRHCGELGGVGRGGLVTSA